MGIIPPFLPQLIESFIVSNTASAALMFGIFGTVWALMQFFFSPILGALSDRFGRRPVMLFSNFGFAHRLPADGAGAVAGVAVRRARDLRHHIGSISTAFAYIADVTPPERRAAVFGLVGAAFGAGFMLGPAVGGLLVDVDPRLPFWVAAGLSFANALYGLLILPKSLPPERCSPFRWQSANPLVSLPLLRRTVVSPVCRRRFSLPRSRMSCCLLPSFCMRLIAIAVSLLSSRPSLAMIFSACGLAVLRV